MPEPKIEHWVFPNEILEQHGRAVEELRAFIRPHEMNLINGGIDPHVMKLDAGAMRNKVKVVFDEEEMLKDLNPPPSAKEKTFKKKGSVGHYYGYDKEGLFGIEIEIEGENLPEMRNAVWMSKRDGSLRGESYEYILAKPLDKKEAQVALANLRTSLTKKKSVVNFSFRTSVHVHVNVCSMVKEELVSFLYLSHLFEDALVEYSGKERVGNRFCLRTKDAEYKFSRLKDFIETKGYPGFGEGTLKYSAINPVTIEEKGSLEFRSLRGTLSQDILNPWLDALESLRNTSLTHTVKELAERVKNNPQQLAKDIFGENYSKFYYDDFYKDIRTNYLFFIEFPYLKIG